MSKNSQSQKNRSLPKMIILSVVGLLIFSTAFDEGQDLSMILMSILIGLHLIAWGVIPYYAKPGSFFSCFRTNTFVKLMFVLFTISCMPQDDELFDTVFSLSIIILLTSWALIPVYRRWKKSASVPEHHFSKRSADGVSASQAAERDHTIQQEHTRADYTEIDLQGFSDSENTAAEVFPASPYRRKARKCIHCGAVSKGDVCEYCGCPFE